MNTTQLVLLALTCINEKRELTHTEQSHVYVFYKTEVESRNISVNEFILTQIESLVNKLISLQIRQSILDLILESLATASNKADKMRECNVK